MLHIGRICVVCAPLCLVLLTWFCQASGTEQVRRRLLGCGSGYFKSNYRSRVFNTKNGCADIIVYVCEALGGIDRVECMPDGDWSCE